MQAFAATVRAMVRWQRIDEKGFEWISTPQGGIG